MKSPTSSTLDKALVMIAAHLGIAVVFRARGSDLWAALGDYTDELSWDWAEYDYEIAPGTASREASAAALPPPAVPEGQDSGKGSSASRGASSRKVSAGELAILAHKPDENNVSDMAFWETLNAKLDEIRWDSGKGSPANPGASWEESGPLEAARARGSRRGRPAFKLTEEKKAIVAQYRYGPGPWRINTLSELAKELGCSIGKTRKLVATTSSISWGQ